MCGIAGFTRLHGAPRRGLASRINELLSHRGPDQQGFYEGSVATLCAVRLAVIDIEGGDQPITAEDGDTTIAFNGEIYNHLEIRTELEALGHRFRSHCDTETVLHAFIEWDTGCFAKLRGMFAAALWVDSRRRLVLARDRMGIKPLYYYRRGDDLCFGSELKAILAHPDVPRTLDEEALDTYLALNYVPGPQTLIAGIKKVRPGHFLEWRNGKTWIEPWWTLPRKPRSGDFEEAKEELDALLRDSVREHLVADVPVGVWASGGLDSSAILHYAAAISAKPLKTFSISFAGRSFDESRYFRDVARAYGTDHYEFDLNPAEDLEKAILDFSYYSDEPSADAGALPVWYLSRLSRRQVTVALSGEGADELFGGYLTHMAGRLARPLRMLPLGPRRLLRRAVERLWPVSDEKIGLEYKLKRWLEGSEMHPDEAHFFWNGAFSADERRGLLSGGGRTLQLLVDQLGIEGAGPTERYLLTDQNYYLPDDILYKTDRMSMAHSLEVRPPFLDHRIVEFAASLPEKFKVRSLQQKYILRDLMRNKLPRAVIERKKTGFDIPTHDWFRGPLRSLLMEVLNPRVIEQTGVLRAGPVESLVRNHMERRVNAGYHLWGLMTLFLWMKRWNVERAPREAPRASRSPVMIH